MTLMSLECTKREMYHGEIVKFAILFCFLSLIAHMFTFYWSILRVVMSGFIW
jgi:hypothetical protein